MLIAAQNLKRGFILTATVEETDMAAEHRAIPASLAPLKHHDVSFRWVMRYILVPVLQMPGLGLFAVRTRCHRRNLLHAVIDKGRTPRRVASFFPTSGRCVEHQDPRVALIGGFGNSEVHLGPGDVDRLCKRSAGPRVEGEPT